MLVMRLLQICLAMRPDGLQCGTTHKPIAGNMFHAVSVSTKRMQCGAGSGQIGERVPRRGNCRNRPEDAGLPGGRFRGSTDPEPAFRIVCCQDATIGRTNMSRMLVDVSHAHPEFLSQRGL